MSNELTITVGGIKDEHCAYLVRVAMVVAELFTADGADRSIDLSLERDHDGLERIHEFMPGGEEKEGHADTSELVVGGRYDFLTTDGTSYDNAVLLRQFTDGAILIGWRIATIGIAAQELADWTLVANPYTEADYKRDRRHRERRQES